MRRKRIITLGGTIVTTVDPAQTSGPRADGSGILNRESKFGLAVAFVTYAGADAVITALTHLNTDTWNGWWARIAQAAVATAIGLLTAWRTKNRRSAGTIRAS
jgi:uncharacterized membrane protein HdeD (DUF308 family)